MTQTKQPPIKPGRFTLERDIVLYKLSEDDILVRLQDELLGWAIGDWLTVEMRRLRSLLQSTIDSLDTLLTQSGEWLDMEDNELRESIPVFKKTVESLEKQQERVESDVLGLAAWLRNYEVVCRFSKEDELSTLINESAGDLTASFNEFMKSWRPKADGVKENLRSVLSKL